MKVKDCVIYKDFEYARSQVELDGNIVDSDTLREVIDNLVKVEKDLTVSNLGVLKQVMEVFKPIAKLTVEKGIDIEEHVGDYFITIEGSIENIVNAITRVIGSMDSECNSEDYSIKDSISSLIIVIDIWLTLNGFIAN